MTSDLGYYRMHRGWQDHPVFRNEPYSERGAWEWLIAHAAYQSKTVSVAGSPLDLERGQLSYSVRFLADRWRWSKSRVARYLERLQKWEMILYETCSKSGTPSGTGQAVITVCNYERYQATPDEGGTATGTGAGQERDRSGTNNKKVKKVKKRESSKTPFPEDWKPTEQHVAYCTSERVDLAHEAEKFRLHAAKNALRYANWNAAFSQWIRNDWVRRLNGNGTHKPEAVRWLTE